MLYPRLSIRIAVLAVLMISYRRLVVIFRHTANIIITIIIIIIIF